MNCKKFTLLILCFFLYNTLMAETVIIIKTLTQMANLTKIVMEAEGFKKIIISAPKLLETLPKASLESEVSALIKLGTKAASFDSKFGYAVLAQRFWDWALRLVHVIPGFSDDFVKSIDDTIFKEYKALFPRTTAEWFEQHLEHIINKGVISNLDDIYPHLGVFPKF